MIVELLVSPNLFRVRYIVLKRSVCVFNLNYNKLFFIYNTYSIYRASW